MDERQRVLTAEVQMVGQVLLLLLLTKTEICLGAEIDLNSGASLNNLITILGMSVLITDHLKCFPGWTLA